jgi:2-C-methyl-D-erythritol 4-phosphate cytidylyltransferase
MLDKSRYFLVMPCAGSGLRAGGEVAKQYQLLKGLPMVVRSLQSLAKVPEIDSAVLVVSPQDTLAQGLVQAHGCHHDFEHFNVLHQGGATRMESVLAGVRSLYSAGAKDRDWVLVHDAARCLVQPQWVQQLIQTVGEDDVGGILAWPVSDTLKEAQVMSTPPAPRILSTLPRAHKWTAQTPQMFRVGLLLNALEKALEQAQQLDRPTEPKDQLKRTLEQHITDEASAVEALGLSPILVNASALNLKITYAEDFSLAQALLSVLESGER